MSDVKPVKGRECRQGGPGFRFAFRATPLFQVRPNAPSRFRPPRRFLMHPTGAIGAAIKDDNAGYVATLTQPTEKRLGSILRDQYKRTAPDPGHSTGRIETIAEPGPARR